MTLALLLAAAAAATSAPATDEAYRAEIEAWRQKREERLKSETGWLSVAGLFWLEPGETTFGSDAKSGIALPDAAPAHAGSFVREGERIVVRPASGVSLTLDGKPIEKETAVPLDGASVKVGRLSLQAIKRGDKIGIRLRDPESPLRREFGTLRWFPIDGACRVTARFVPDEKPKTVGVTNVLGQRSDEPSPGSIEFELGGKTLHLRPYIEDGDASQWFYVFRDETAPKETYGGGRFVYSAPAENGRVVLDFNKAYNPPCAFNPYTTCPLPPRENELPLAVRAGEMTYKK